MTNPHRLLLTLLKPDATDEEILDAFRALTGRAPTAEEIEELKKEGREEEEEEE